VACGALAGHVRDIVTRRGWPAAVRPLPAILHNRPQDITLAAERAVVSALRSGRIAARVDTGVSRLERALEELL
jgi:hypothetical protein